jgi:two-component system phosphate regulon response regulator PhoB
MRQVVIIEDEADINDLLARWFASEGFRVTTTGDGRAGLHAVQQSRPDLVILDMRLPTMSGWEVCRWLRASEDTRRIPIIVISAISGTEDRIAALEMGVDDFIVKPFSVREVMARSRAVLRRSEQRIASARLEGSR